MMEADPKLRKEHDSLPRHWKDTYSVSLVIERGEEEGKCCSNHFCQVIVGPTLLCKARTTCASFSWDPCDISYLC